MSTSTTDRPQTSDQTQPRDTLSHHSSAKTFDLSVTQVVGASLAAATAAALGSRLGVVGTISGAALVSVVASVASALYTASLRRTRERVSSALVTVRGDRPTAPAAADADADVLPVTDRRAVSTDPIPRPRRDRRPPSALSFRRVLAGAAAVFALTAAGVTGFELVTGTSFEGTSGGTTVGSTLSGSGSGGTSTSQQRSTQPTTSPSPSASTSATPTAAAASSATASPTATAINTSAPSATSSPSAAASSTATPSATDTPTATAGTSATPTSAVTAGGLEPGPDGR